MKAPLYDLWFYDFPLWAFEGEVIFFEVSNFKRKEKKVFTIIYYFVTAILKQFRNNFQKIH